MQTHKHFQALKVTDRVSVLLVRRQIHYQFPPWPDSCFRSILQLIASMGQAEQPLHIDCVLFLSRYLAHVCFKADLEETLCWGSEGLSLPADWTNVFIHCDMTTGPVDFVQEASKRRRRQPLCTNAVTETLWQWANASCATFTSHEHIAGFANYLIKQSLWGAMFQRLRLR